MYLQHDVPVPQAPQQQQQGFRPPALVVDDSAPGTAPSPHTHLRQALFRGALDGSSLYDSSLLASASPKNVDLFGATSPASASDSPAARFASKFGDAALDSSLTSTHSASGTPSAVFGGRPATKRFALRGRPGAATAVVEGSQFPEQGVTSPLTGHVHARAQPVVRAPVDCPSRLPRLEDAAAAKKPRYGSRYAEQPVEAAPKGSNDPAQPVRFYQPCDVYYLAD